ncbi:MAG TPA: sensor histidine kinase, partial [Anaerolineales bacterium]|nr:sensor histidine kinase [Anaerolineales bacterium]
RVLRSTFKPFPAIFWTKYHQISQGYNAVVMMMKLQRSNNPEVWEQWDWVWHVSAYSLLILNSIFVYNSEPRITNFLFFLVLSALLGLWYIPFVNRSTLRIWDNPKRGALYLVPGWVIWGGLISLTADSLLLIGIFFPIIFSRFPIRWSTAITIFQTLGLYFIYIMLYPTEHWFAILMIILGLLIISTIIGAFITSIIKQSTDRQHLIDELTRSRANLMKVEREAGRLTERQRLARDIHDTLAQHFTSIIMHLSAAKYSSPESVQSEVQQAEESAREGLAEIRRIVWDMQPEQIEKASLVEAVEELAARWSAENSVLVKMKVTGTPRSLPSSAETALLRISQEAMHNITKHAQAKNVNITFSFMEDLFVMDFADDGLGFDPSKTSNGFGLKTMRDRIEELSGIFTIESEQGRGTAIAVSLPISENKDD